LENLGLSVPVQAGRRPEKGPKREEQVSKFRTSIPEDRE
jgi:hypothetical protein